MVQRKSLKDGFFMAAFLYFEPILLSLYEDMPLLKLGFSKLSVFKLWELKLLELRMFSLNENFLVSFSCLIFDSKLGVNMLELLDSLC